MNSNPVDVARGRAELEAAVVPAVVPALNGMQRRSAPVMQTLLTQMYGTKFDTELPLSAAERLIVDAQSTDLYGLLLEGLLLKAYVLLTSAQTDKGVEALRRGLVLGRLTGQSTVFLWSLAEIAGYLCGAAMQHGIEVEYVRSLAAQLDARANGRSAVHLPVRIYTLGRFDIAVDDQPLQVSAKAPRKPLELLRALIAMGGRAVDVKAMLAQVWPSEGAGARSSFDVALMRLRKLLRYPDSLVLDKGKLSLSDARCWVDAWSFEADVAHLDGGAASDSSAAVLELYSGPFLHEHALPCIVNKRDRLASKFKRAVLALGKQHERTECWESAAQIYRRGLEQDNLAEELYRSLMYCEWKLGQHNEAVKTYRRCCTLLSINLQTKPSADTEALYKRVSTN